MTTTSPETRLLPNILITGTPGTGKTTLARELHEANLTETNFQWIESKEIIQTNQCTDGHDNELNTDYLDEDKFLDALELKFDDENVSGGIILDFHIPEIFPERWFDLVLVCRTSTEVLFDRLTERKYDPVKRDNNVQAEIMQVVYEAAVEAYDVNIVQCIDNNTREDLASTIERVTQWMQQWQKDRTNTTTTTMDS